MSIRPYDKRNRKPTIDDADHKGRVHVWHNGEWVLVDYDTAATFEGVTYWKHNMEVSDADLRIPRVNS